MNRRFLLAGIALLFSILPLALTSTKPALAAAPAAIQGLHVSGNQILNSAGQTVRLLGVNRSGAEFMCVQNKGIWDGPVDAASVQTMASWKINAVRVPLNEDCWLAINGINSAYAGANYQQAIVDYVNLLNSNGLVAILDLHWTAAGTTQPTGQQPMPDRDHAPAFWTSVANTFKSNSSVIFDLFNEPYPDQSMDATSAWNCLKNGGNCSGLSFTAAGMQELVNAVRGTGATNIIMSAGLRWTNDLSQWLSFKPSDSTGNLAASMHVYNFNACINSSCWDSQVAPVLNSVPLVVGEMGENDCAHGFIDTFMSWLDAHNASYLGWTWNTWDCSTGPALITDYNGTATNFGIGLKNHLASLSQNPTNTPVPTFQPPTNTPFSATNTSVPPTATSGATSVPGSFKVQYMDGENPPNTGDNQIKPWFNIINLTSSSVPLSDFKIRYYFTKEAGGSMVWNCDWAVAGCGNITATFGTISPAVTGADSYVEVGFTSGTIPGSMGSSGAIQARLNKSDWTNFNETNDYSFDGTKTAFADWSKMTLYRAGTLVWGTPPGGSSPTNTPVPPTNTSVPPTATRVPPTNTPVGPTPTNTPVTPTAVKTNTPVPPTNTPGTSTLNVQINKGNGVDTNQQTGFNFLVKNTGSSALSNLSVRVYFNTDGSNAASGYILEKYYDQSGVATVSGPTQACGSTYYFTVSYGTASLAAGAQWEYQTAMHLTSWASTFDGSNDFFHTGYAVGALPASYTSTAYLPGFVNGSLAWGGTPNCTGGTNTPVPPTNTSVPPTATRVPPTNTPVPPTATPGGPTVTPVPPTATPTGPTPTPPPNGTHLSNPFVGAKWFVNPAWAAEVNASTVTAAQKALVASQSTAVWLDSKAAVNGTNGYPYSITGWLDQAELQGANLIIFVVYDLPQRDCSALASNGEIPGTQAGLLDYETNYIDPIAAAQGQAKYANLRIINIVEPDSLPNLVTNTGIAACQTANGLYQAGIEYALNKLHPITNTYNYLDIGHGGWLGWSNNFTPAITLISGVIKATNAGVNSVDGFISNTANTVPVSEPYMTATQSIGGNPVNSVTFYSYNPYISEDAYDAAWASAMRGAGLPASSTNMLVDTSRNGWGGCGGGPNVSQNCRPTGPSTATDVTTFVTMSRIDRRPARGDWCNQNGAGIGFRPQANPAGGVYQAYVWIKPPGESDGSSSLIPVGPDNPNGKGFDRMCDPTYGGNSLNQNSPTNALPNAPVSGVWFEAQFDQLVANAYPPLQ